MLRNSFLRAEKMLLQALRILLGLEFIEERGRIPAENIFNIGNVNKIVVGGISDNENESENDNFVTEEWLKTANKKTFDEVKKDVVMLFPFLSEPKTPETPQLVEFEYYKGCSSLVSSEYKPDQNFISNAPRQIKGHLVSLDKLHATVGAECSRHVMLLGSAGAGKTTLVKRYTKMVFLKQVKQLKHVKLIIYMEFRKLCGQEKITPQELFVDSRFPQLTKKERDRAFKWMKKNSGKMLLSIDGYDQATWTLAGNYRKISYETRTGIATIMHNVFSGHLFPDMWLLTSSRDHSLCNLEGEVRPHKTIQLAGLTRSSIESLVKGYGGTEGERIWAALCKMKSSIMSFCTVPVFLVFSTSALYEDDENDRPPDTFSGIMLRVLLNLIHSQHAHRNTAEVLAKLQRMAFRGTKEKRVLFRMPDLQECGLKYEDIQDLVITVPGQTRSKISQRFLEGSNVMFFCHQSMQETLTALYITCMAPDCFQEFLATELQKPHWSVVKLLVYGTLLNPDTSAFRKELCKEHEKYDNLSFQEKQQMLLDHLQTMRKTNIDTLMVLYEAGEGANRAIEASTGPINLHSKPLTESSVHMLSYVMIRRSYVRELNLSECNMQESLLDDLMTALMGSSTKIHKLNMGGNKLLQDNGFCSLGTIIQQCKVESLNLEDCNLNGRSIKQLRSSLGNLKNPITTLNVSWNQQMDFDGFVELGHLVKSCGSRKITLRRCDLTSQLLTAFELSLAAPAHQQTTEKERFMKLDILDVSENYTLSREGYGIVGNIAGKHKVDELILNDCNLTPKELSGLEETLRRYRPRIKTLKVSVNTTIDRDGFCSLGNIVNICRVQELHLRHCELTAYNLSGMLHSLDGVKHQMTMLDIGWNQALGEEGCRVLGKILRKCDTEYLVMDNCNLTPRQVFILDQSIPVGTLSTLDLSYNPLRGEHIDAIGSFASKISSKLKLSIDKVECSSQQSLSDILYYYNADLDIEWQ